MRGIGGEAFTPSNLSRRRGRYIRSGRGVWSRPWRRKRASTAGGVRLAARLDLPLLGLGLDRDFLADHVVPAELLAQRGGEAGGVVFAVARLEAREQARGDDRRRYVLVDRRLHRPAPFAAVLDVRLDRLERVVFREHLLGQLEQPRADHAAAVPHARHLVEVERELAFAEDLEPFAV